MNGIHVVRGYSLQLASDVFERDGIGLELLDEDGRKVAEVFRDDEKMIRTFATEAAVRIPFEVMTWFMERARERL